VCSTVVVAVVEERWVVAAHYSDSCAVLCCGPMTWRSSPFLGPQAQQPEEQEQTEAAGRQVIF